ncbi:unnamed protein product, partial [Didymodactylos carnosus]
MFRCAWACRNISWALSACLSLPSAYPGLVCRCL